MTSFNYVCIYFKSFLLGIHTAKVAGKDRLPGHYDDLTTMLCDKAKFDYVQK